MRRARDIGISTIVTLAAMTTLVALTADAVARQARPAPTTEAMAPRETGAVGGSLTKSLAGKSTTEKSAAERPSQSTLTPADLAPAWRGPPARKDGKRAA